MILKENQHLIVVGQETKGDFSLKNEKKWHILFKWLCNEMLPCCLKSEVKMINMSNQMIGQADQTENSDVMLVDVQNS